MSSKDHWDDIYNRKHEAELSWHQDEPAISLELMERIGLTPSTSVIDIGAGTSRVVDRLLALGVHDLSVLDLSEAALTAARQRLGAGGKIVNWIVADITTWQPLRLFDIWHDRAVFHFLQSPDQRAAYVQRLSGALRPGGHAIMATFAPDGPERCSGLAVTRYSPDSLHETLGAGFALLAHRQHVHQTPWGQPQSFQYSLLRKI